MTPATFDVMEQRLISNQVDPETRVNLLLAIEAPLTGLAILFVAARFYSRTWLKAVLGRDDWVMAIATLFALTITVLHCVSTQWAIGYHYWEIKPSWYPETAKITWATLVLSAPTASLTKISICLTYLRVFPSLSDRRFAQLGIIFSVLYCAIITLLNILQCLPIHSYWDTTVELKCIDREALTIAAQAFNSISDFLIFLWPARTLSGIRLPRKQRFGLIFVFSIGVCVCAAGLCRVWYLTVYFKTKDVFYEGAIVFILASVEMNLAIICGSLPGCKPLLARAFPKLFGSTGNYCGLNRSRYALPGARISLRFPHERGVYRAPSRSLSTVSAESVPVKLEIRNPAEYDGLDTVVVLTPIQKVYSPTTCEKALAGGASSWLIATDHRFP